MTMPIDLAGMCRVFIVGAAGSGKSTLAKELSEFLGLRYTGLDSLCWKPSPPPWTRVPPEEVGRALEPLIAGERWIIEGAQEEFLSHILRRADTFIWLDLELGLSARWGLFVRTIQRMLKAETICNGNRETLGRLLSRNSVFTSARRRRRAHQRELPRVFSREGDASYSHVERIRLQTPASVAHLLSSISKEVP